MCEISKKDKIVTSFIDELSVHGYENANTNTVCAKAEVSKGLLFHYYESKEKLFLHIANETLDMLENYFNGFDIENLNFIGAINKFTYEKAIFFSDNPQYFKLFAIILFEVPKNLEKILNEKIEKIMSVIKQKLGLLLIKENLKKNVTITEVINLIFSILRILSDKYGAVITEADYSKTLVDDMINEFYNYFNIILEGIFVK